MSTIETGGSAFPLYDYRGDGQPFLAEIGMTMRQYAAIHLRVPNSGADPASGCWSRRTKGSRSSNRSAGRMRRSMR